MLALRLASDWENSPIGKRAPWASYPAGSFSRIGGER